MSDPAMPSSARPRVCFLSSQHPPLDKRVFEKEALSLLREKLFRPAYDMMLKSSHIFNMLDARGVLSPSERQAYIARVRNLAKGCAMGYLENK